MIFECIRGQSHSMKIEKVGNQLVSGGIGMDNRFEISVVIPNYNNAKYLAQCIQSVSNQTYHVSKIIVVDDCSTDNSISILNDLRSKICNLTVISLKTNGGVSHARNVGVNHVETPYVTFMDSDDFYSNPRKIENEMGLIKKISEIQKKDVVAYSRIDLVSVQGISLGNYCFKKKYYLEGNIFSDVLTRKYAFTIMRDYCLPTEVIRSIGGYNEESNLYEDLELILKLAQRIDFAYTGELGTAYRQVKAGLSSKPKQEHIDKLNEIFETYTQGLSNVKKTWYRIIRQIHIQENQLIILFRRGKNKLYKVVRAK